MTIRLMLVDDHRMLRQGLRRSLEEEGFYVVGEASDGEEAVRLVPAAKPDVILMDVSMPDMDGIEATRRIINNDPEQRIVMLTMHADKDLIDAAIKAGAVGYLTKDCSTDEVIEAVKLAANGETALSPQLAKSMLTEVRKIDEKAARRGRPPRHQAGRGSAAADRRRVLDARSGAEAVHQPEDGEEPPGVYLREAERP